MTTQDDEHTRYANEILAAVFGTFAGKPKRARLKPNRCLGCGKVSKHIFHNQECQELYRGTQAEETGDAVD